MKLKIAYVDDDNEFVKYALQYLSSNQEFELEAFCNEKIFLERISQMHFDIICIDYDMPIRTGFDYIGLEALKNSLIILVTRHKSLTLIKEGYKHGIFRYVTKDSFVREISEALHDAKNLLSSERIMTFKIGRGFRRFNLKYVTAVYSENHYVNIVSDDGKIFSSRIPIKFISEELLANDFAKSESNTFINLHRVIQIDNQCVYLDNGSHFKLNKSMYKEVLSRYLEVLRCITL